jgi:hypothetical protein
MPANPTHLIAQLAISAKSESLLIKAARTYATAERRRA